MKFFSLNVSHALVRFQQGPKAIFETYFSINVCLVYLKFKFNWVACVLLLSFWGGGWFLSFFFFLLFLGWMWQLYFLHIQDSIGYEPLRLFFWGRFHLPSSDFSTPLPKMGANSLLTAPQTLFLRDSDTPFNYSFYPKWMKLRSGCGVRIRIFILKSPTLATWKELKLNVNMLLFSSSLVFKKIMLYNEYELLNDWILYTISFYIKFPLDIQLLI